MKIDKFIPTPMIANCKLAIKNYDLKVGELVPGSTSTHCEWREIPGRKDGAWGFIEVIRDEFFNVRLRVTKYDPKTGRHVQLRPEKDT